MALNPSAGGNMQFNPLSQIQVNSAHPEAIAQGFDKGLASGVSTGMMFNKIKSPAQPQPAPYAEGQAPVISQSPAQATPFYQQAVSDMGYSSNYSPALQQAMFNAGAPAPMNATYFSGNPFLQ